jgi:hypothetical protein
VGCRAVGTPMQRLNAVRAVGRQPRMANTMATTTGPQMVNRMLPIA